MVLSMQFSHHYPQNIENKKCEFDLASFGMINLETFAAANTALKDILSIEELISKFTSKPKAILGLKNEAIEEGCLADLTLFNLKFKWKYEQEKIVSKSKNSGLLGKTFTGSLAVINNGQISICD